MMKVLGICASARKNGNTAIMMRKVFEALEKEGIETELVPVRRGRHRAVQSVLGMRRKRKLRP